MRSPAYREPAEKTAESINEPSPVQGGLIRVTGGVLLP
jgi:hypothetical protein